MNRLEKLGYFLVGVGIGGLIATYIYEKELHKQIGEEEEYVSAYEDESSEDDNTDISPEDEVENAHEFSNTDVHLNDMYEASSDDSIGMDELEKRAKKRREKSDYTRYSKMYTQVEKDKNKMTKAEAEYQESLSEIEQARLERLKELQQAEELEKQRQEKILQKRSEDYIDDDYPEDDDYEYYDDDILDDDLVRERVENNFEIYLGENPQDFITLIFYEGDNTLADDREHIVPDPFGVVGEVALSRLITGGQGVEDGVIYVRNLKTMLNYEIVLDAGSYSETVLGILDSRRRQNSGADRNGNP